MAGLLKLPEIRVVKFPGAFPGYFIARSLYPVYVFNTGTLGGL